MGNRQQHIQQQQPQQQPQRVHVTAPEDVWLPFLRDLYPGLLQRPHFFPPLFFNRVPRTVATIATQTVRVTVNPPPPPSGTSRQRRRQRAKSHSISPTPNPSASIQPSTCSSPTGTVFAENPAGLQDERFQDTDLQDDEAHYRCLQTLRDIPEAMMVISQLKFRKYLDSRHNPLQHVNPTNVISQLPSITHPSVPQNIADGECDIIVLHRQYGILVAEVKSVGGQYLSCQTPARAAAQHQIIVKVITKAIQQLDNQEVALQHLVQDMAGGHIRVTKAILLPNITTGQLTAAVNSSQQLRQDLCRCTKSDDVSQTVSKCLCSDQLQQPYSWWNALWKGGPDPSMSDSIYERLAARFCGPVSTVDIPTCGHPHKVLRSPGQAVAETALRFSSLVLTPPQLALLNLTPEPHYMYLQGPPGCGKTVVLVLKALQWARRGKKVVVVQECKCLQALAILLEEQLRSCLAPAPSPGSIQRHFSNICDDRFDVTADVCKLLQKLGPDPDPEALILLDEIPVFSYCQVVPWLTAVHDSLPRVAVWSAGPRRWDSPTYAPPSWLEIQTLREPLRCPPAVTRQVEKSSFIDDVMVPLYADPVLPLPTQGSPVQNLQHDGQPGHSEDQPWQCVKCADHIGHFLTQELRVGQPGHPQYRDTFIVCSDYDDAHAADVMVKRLRLRHRMPVRAVSRPPSYGDARELALGITDQVMVSHVSSVLGLERAVVIVLGRYGMDFPSCSRCTGVLCIIH